MLRKKQLLPMVVAVGIAMALSACTEKESSSDADGTDAIKIVSTDKECRVSPKSAPSGNITFDVKNSGSKVTEFYLLGADGLKIIGEVENIGPGLTRKLIVTAGPGKYFGACKPGMVGDGIRSDFEVTDSGTDLTPEGEFADQLTAATDKYASYVRDQADQLVVGTAEFVELYKGGNDDAAREKYAPTRMHWERIEPVAESFGDLDPKLDLREADLEAGQTWTGWHRIEKDLWPQGDPAYKAMSPAERAKIADQLVTDTKDLRSRIQDLTYTPTQLGNGAKELLDEVATGKVTGEEEIWSGTDLWDFQANVDGARIAFEVLEPVVTAKDKALSETLTERFASLQSLLDSHRKDDGFKGYKELTSDEVKVLADAVNALSEPLSKLTATVAL